MKANSEKTKQSKKATRRVLAGVLCGASVLSLVLSLVMPPISQAIANDAETGSTEVTVADASALGEDAGADENVLGEEAGAGNSTGKDAENQISDDAEGGKGEDAAAADPAADGAGAESAAQPADDGQSVDKVATVANEGEVPGLKKDKDGYALLERDEDLSTYLDLPAAEKPAKLRLAADISSSEPIPINEKTTINKDTTIDLAHHKLYYSSGNNGIGDTGCTFITISKGFTLTVEGKAEDSPTEVTSGEPSGEPGQLAQMQFTGSVPQQLTYYVTKSKPNGVGTSEKTYLHTVTNFGAIVACKEGYVNRVISVAEGGTLNLKGGMITTPRTLGNDGHVILSQGAVNISGGYVTNGNGGGWGGGLCITGAKASLEMTDGVVAGNKAASGGGIFANNGATLKLAGGIISGNATYSDSVGLGGGILVSGGSVTVSGGYITNNKYAKFCGTDGNGCHGGAGLAANSGAHVNISGGQITGNYSDEAGGGVYVTNLKQQGKAWLNIKGGIIASNVSYRSEGAGIRVGQRVDAMINGPKDINGTKESIVYITNNHCMSRFDWGGGGIFVQGDSQDATNAGRLFVYNSYISSNTAGGYGGGVAVCPSGKTLVTNTEGTAIFGNKSAGADDHGEIYPDPAYNPAENTGNDKAPHLSAGNDGKDQDKTAYLKDVFRNNGHADFFLAAHDHNTPIAVVTGEMLGGGDARYSGSIELEKAINIPANGAVGVKNSIGLTSGVMAEDEAAINARNQAQNEATTFITGNYSWDHGGGIMSNGDLYLGQPTDAYVYPSIKATKELIDSQTDGKKPLTANEFTFKVYRKGSQDPFANGTFDRGACIEVGNASNDANGNITFNLGEQSAPSSSAGEITYYLVEDAGNDPYIKYDSAVYEIVGTLKDNVTVLMSVPTLNDESKTKEISVHNYTLENARVIKHSGDSINSLCALKDDGQGYYSIVNSDGSKTFTNTYTSSFSWIPKATKVVEGGEMKVFTLQLADNPMFDNAQEVKTQANGVNSQPLEFGNISYTLDDSTKGADSTGRSAPKDFPYYYYVCEKDESEKYPHYKFDHSVYRFEVDRPSVTNGTINYKVTYMKGYVDSKNNWIADDGAEAKTFIDTSAPNSTDKSTPAFTNTYSTSLPLSGMSGVTLTYLAGAAVLCAAAAWMHIRRKANAKGGKRRE